MRRTRTLVAYALTVTALGVPAVANAAPTPPPPPPPSANAQPFEVPQGQPPIAAGAADDPSGHGWALKGGGLVGGFDDQWGFFLASANGQSYLHPGMYFAGYPSYDLSNGRGPDPTGSVQLDLDGSLFSRDLTYNFQLNLGAAGDGPPPTVEVAEASYAFYHNFYDHDLVLEVGAYKNPLFKESGHVQDWNGLFVQRSLTEDLVGGGQYGEQVRGLGVQWLGDDAQPIRAGGNLYEGTDIGASGLSGLGSITGGLSLRMDYKFWGHWDDTTDLTGMTDGRADLLDVGGGLAFEDAHGNDGVRLTVDGQYQVSRQWTAYGALYFDHFGVSRATAAAAADTAFQVAALDPVADSRNDFGFLLEGGYRVIPEVQVVARLSLTRLSPTFTADDGESVFSELSIGANYFLGPKGAWANHARVGLDLTYLPTGAPENNVLYTKSASTDFEVRALFQLQF
jgi:hypothetical protein